MERFYHIEFIFCRFLPVMYFHKYIIEPRNQYMSSYKSIKASVAL